MAVYLGNAFSLQMIKNFPTSVKVEEVKREDIPSDAVSIVGHVDTARLLGVPFNRISVNLEKGDVLYVAQLVGGRLPEGVMTLPDGYKFIFLKVTVGE